jgi:hypothetical protein
MATYHQFEGLVYMNKIKVLHSAGATLALLLACAQPASAREFADIYTQCGLGAIIAPNNDAVAAVTNVTWDSGTTAVSSDASSADSCKGGQKKTAALILEAYPQIERDLAAGTGKHLTALLAATGCKADTHASLAASLRSSLATKVGMPDYSSRSRYDLAQDLFEDVRQRVEGDLAASCTDA